jgi:pimeloyl-ACP methyl ester carboxylesterase
MLTFVLIHGAWHDGSCWDEVAAHLRNGGHVVHAPTIAGNGRNADRRVDHAVCTKSIVDFFVSQELGGVVLVGHSYGGTIIAKVAEAEPQRLRRLVFFNAFVLNDSQCLFDETPQNVEHTERGARASGDDTFLPPFDMVRDAFFNTVSREDALRFYGNWTPQPIQPFRDKLDLKKFFTLDVPKSYLHATEDIRVPMPERSWHPRFSNRLRRFRYVAMPGDHEAMYTNPALLAQKLVDAGRD